MSRHALLVVLLTAGGLGAAACSPGPVDAVALTNDSLWTGMVAHYTFDEGDGTVLPDHSGFGRDGTLHGTSWVTEGRFGGAMRFDYGTFITVADFPDATASWSVAVWLKLPPTGEPSRRYATVLSAEEDLTGGWQVNVTPGPSMHYAFWTGPNTLDYAYAEARVSLDQWIHVVGVVDGKEKTITLYIGGQAVVRKSIPHTILPGVPQLSMGTWSGVVERYFVGLVDEVLIYSRALAADEVHTLGEHALPDPQ